MWGADKEKPSDREEHAGSVLWRLARPLSVPVAQAVIHGHQG